MSLNEKRSTCSLDLDSMTTYISCPEAALFNYGHFHPMKPIRMAMANHILAQVPHNMNIVEINSNDTSKFFEELDTVESEKFLIKFKKPYEYSICDLNNPDLFNDDSPRFENCDKFIKLYATTSLCAGEIALTQVLPCYSPVINNAHKFITENTFNKKAFQTGIFCKNNIIQNLKEIKETRHMKRNLMFKRFGLNNKVDSEIHNSFRHKEVKTYNKEFINKIMGINFTETLFNSKDNLKNRKQNNIQRIKESSVIDPILKEMFCGSEKEFPFFLEEKNISQQRDQKLIINYSGGLHHGRKTNFDGFCYVNDIVHLINLLLSGYKRVLYVDIDIHHGDGVEEAFRFNSNVHTFSVHRYGDFFPHTGSLISNTSSTTNIPLLRGITDPYYLYIFEPVLKSILETFKPSICVIQCGGDSLAEDLIGDFNVSMKGHRNIILNILNEFYNRKLTGKCILLGGGGYTPKNVARTWAYESLFLSKFVDSKFNYKSSLNKYGTSLTELESIFDAEIDKYKVNFFGEEIPIIKKLKQRGTNENRKPYLDNVLSYILQVLDPRV